MAEYLDIEGEKIPAPEPRFDPLRLFDDVEFLDVLDKVNSVTRHHQETLSSRVENVRLSNSARIIFMEDLTGLYNLYRFDGDGWHYSKMFDVLSDLGIQIQALDHMIGGDEYFNQELIVGKTNLLLTWPQSAEYLLTKYSYLKSLYEALIYEVNENLKREHSSQYPGINLITRSHTDWINSFQLSVASRTTTKQRYDGLVEMRDSLRNVIELKKPKHRKTDDGYEIFPGLMTLPDVWYEINSDVIRKHSHHRPDLDSLVAWLEARISEVVPTFTIKQGQHKTAAAAKDALKGKLRRMMVDNDITVDSLDKFLDSNFKMAHQSAVSRSPYSLSMGKKDNVKAIVSALSKILDEFVTEVNKADRLLWFHILIGSSSSYNTLKDYVYRIIK